MEGFFLPLSKDFNETCVDQTPLGPISFQILEV